jgi:Zn-finger nucleic acid-binding protein
MKCPTCSTIDLLMTERLNIEIDYCPQCRGVWLDRGELDKIIERSLRDAVPAATAPNQSNAYAPQAQPQYHHDGGYRERHHDEHDNYRGKKSIWKELFD